MPAITLKNIPEPLYLLLKEAAKIHHRSLNSEIIYYIERGLGTHKVDVSEQIETARILREKTNANPITNDELTAAKNEGRL